jgi:SAM-dependent methyltransferase
MRSNSLKRPDQMVDSFTWRSESDEPAPSVLTSVDDRLSAAAALNRIRGGEYLLYTGDFYNAKQLLGAVGRRLTLRNKARSPLEAFRAERKARDLEHRTLSHILVALDGDYRLRMSRAPDVAQACRWVWGEPETETTVTPLKTLLGMLGSAEWRRKGLAVPGLQGLLRPHYGVYLPTRTDYIELMQTVPEAEGKRVFDIGTGTGVLSFLLLQRGADSAIGTDMEPRAVACARESAAELGLWRRFEAIETDLFPKGRADLVISNPPWIPEPPKNRVDRAVFDPGNDFLRRFLEGLNAHLVPGGLGLLLLSDLAVLLGLRPAGWLDEQLARSNLQVRWKSSGLARHSRAKDPTDPLHAIRSQEVTTLYALSSKVIC